MHQLNFIYKNEGNLIKKCLSGNKKHIIGLKRSKDSWSLVKLVSGNRKEKVAFSGGLDNRSRITAPINSMSCKLYEFREAYIMVLTESWRTQSWI